MSETLPNGWRLVRSRRRSVAIHVLGPDDIEVRAPQRLPMVTIQLFIHERHQWVERARARLRLRPEREVDDLRLGGHVRWLGERRVLQALPGQPPGDVASTAELWLRVPANATPAAVERAVAAHWRDHGRAILEGRLRHWHAAMEAWSLPTVTLDVRRMSRRWGSCRRTGKITLNSQLLRYPMTCIDAVIVHELCHLVHFDHSRAFKALMTTVMPYWKQADALLADLSQRY